MTALPPPSADRIRDELRHFLARTFFPGRDSGSIRGEVPLLANDILDSVGFLELIVHLEESYEIEIPRADVTPENFGTLGTLVRYLLTRTARA